MLRDWLGSGLLLAGGIWTGLRRQRWYQDRCRFLSAMLSDLLWLEQELSQRETETALLLEHLSCGSRPTAILFRNYAEGLERLEEAGLEGRWQQLLAEEVLPLQAEERELLARLGGILGRYDGRTQAKLFRQLREELAERLLQAKQDGRQKGQAAFVLGISAALLVVILLL